MYLSVPSVYLILILPTHHGQCLDDDRSKRHGLTMHEYEIYSNRISRRGGNFGLFEQVGKNDGSLIDLAMTSVSFEEQKRQHSLRPEDNGRAERARIGGVGRPGTRYADTLQTRVSNPNRHLGRTPVDESLVDLTTSSNDEVILYQSATAIRYEFEGYNVFSLQIHR